MTLHNQRTPQLSHRMHEELPGVEEVSSHSSDIVDDHLHSTMAGLHLKNDHEEDRNHMEIKSNSCHNEPVALTNANPRKSRASIRKSINGMVIEFDEQDQNNVALFQGCDDYTEDVSASSAMDTPSTAVEELRTRFEALDDAVYQHQKPPTNTDDLSHLAQDCLRKNMLEALENSPEPHCSSTRCAAVHNSLSHTMTASTTTNVTTTGTVGRGGSRRHSHCGVTPALARRRRSEHNERRSVFGLVLEYADFDDLSETSHVEEEVEQEEECDK